MGGSNRVGTRAGTSYVSASSVSRRARKVAGACCGIGSGFSANVDLLGKGVGTVVKHALRERMGVCVMAWMWR